MKLGKYGTRRGKCKKLMGGNTFSSTKHSCRWPRGGGKRMEMEDPPQGSMEQGDPREWSAEEVATRLRSWGTAACYQSATENITTLPQDTPFSPFSLILHLLSLSRRFAKTNTAQSAKSISGRCTFFRGVFELWRKIASSSPPARDGLGGGAPSEESLSENSFSERLFCNP
jgi:hypothetical protein